MPGGEFGEGLVRTDTNYYMLTYTERHVYKLDLDFKLLETLTMPENMREGWGMTFDG